MIFQLSSKTYRSNGSVTIVADVGQTTLGAVQRRNSRSATLNGGVAISDFGYSEGDRTINLVFASESQDQIDTIKGIVQNSARVLVAYSEGVYEAIVTSFVPSTTSSRLNLEIVSKTA